MMRLDKLLAQCGAGSRSDVKDIISKGQVLINGDICRDPARKIDEASDDIICRGMVVTYCKYVYFMLNKPQGVISASRSTASRSTAKMRDEHRDEKNNESETGDIAEAKRAAMTCVDLIHEETHRDLFPVGRLDRDTEGLLLITDDGQLAHELLSPRKHVDKIYYAELELPLAEADRRRLEAGVDIGDERPTLPAAVKSLSEKAIEITIHEGRFHQIKRMLEAVDNRVTFLKRLQMGTLRLDGSLKPGEYRRLTQEEIDRLRGDSFDGVGDVTI